jgi:hypothetical protein
VFLPFGPDALRIPVRKRRARARWLALIAVLLLAATVTCWPRNPHTREPVISFAGFKNHGTELHAWFWFTNGSLPSVHWITSVSHKIENDWHDGGGVGVMIHEKKPEWYRDRWPSVDPAHQIYLVSFKVTDTSLPLRVVMLVQERSSGIVGLKETLQQLNYDHFQRRSMYVAGGRRYSVTNEFSQIPRALQSGQAPLPF